MTPVGWRAAPWLAAVLALAPPLHAQRAQFAQRDPHIGYVYPAGGRQGAAFQVAVGGQFLDGVSDAHFSGKGVQAAVVKHSKPLTPQQVSQLQEKLQEARKQMQAAGINGPMIGRRGDFATLAKIAKEIGVNPEDLKALAEFRKLRSDPKRQLNPQIAETVTLQVKIDADAAPGERTLRLKTPSGLSNPLRFQVGRFPEYCETEPNDKTADDAIDGPLPVVLNGQIMPGDVDRFQFQARKGQRLVAAVSARELMPYLADAVPGWFQAAVSLDDASGREAAYADDFQFHPDPVLCCEIPEGGVYTLEIKDAIYRGREDFVYRVTLGETPLVTSIFPLGGREGDPATVKLTGWNLPTDRLTLEPENREPGIRVISLLDGQGASNRVPFAVDTLPECFEQEPNDEERSAQRLSPPLIVNGRIDRPGDWDVFHFEGRAGGQVVVEVLARRLNSPLDSLLKLTDAQGRQLMANDDHEDKGEGLATHHADSQMCVTLPADGSYYVHLGDTQNKGGEEFGYRLRISARRPDFELRVVPSSINARAGQTLPITVYALRRDGFSDEIALALKNAPPGFALSGAWVPAQQDQLRLTLTVPPVPLEAPVSLQIEGRAAIQGRVIRRPAVPADDMMQAFIYHHLVPAEDWMVSVAGRGRLGAALQAWGKGRLRGASNFRAAGGFAAAPAARGDTPVKLPTGGTVQVQVPSPVGTLLDQVQLQLSEPPEGVAIEKVSSSPGAVAILLRADAAKAKPGLKGNLIVEASVERTFPRPDGKQPGVTRRVPLGALPAIPFEIVGR